MKLFSGKRIGQSGQELVAATIFSFALHVLTVVVAVFLVTATPKRYIPPYYNVKLVGPLADSAQAPTAPTAPAAPPAQAKPEPKPAHKEKRNHARERRMPAMKKGAMPELGRAKPKQTLPEQEKPVEHASKQPAAPGTAKGEAVSPGANTQGVAVAIPEEFKQFSWYLASVSQKIRQNWNPPPDARDARARVVFSINRSGWVETVNVKEDQSSGTYQFKLAAIRAIRASNPFPPFPEELPKQSMELSADLTPVE